MNVLPPQAPTTPKVGEGAEMPHIDDLAARFDPPIEGYSYPIFMRGAATLVVIGLALLTLTILWKQSVNQQALWSVLVMLAGVAVLGWQVVFGKTRIDRKGLYRSSFYRPHVSWFEVQRAHYQGLPWAPRLNVGSMIGPLRFHAGTAELRKGLESIAQYYTPSGMRASRSGASGTDASGQRK